MIDLASSQSWLTPPQFKKQKLLRFSSVALEVKSSHPLFLLPSLELVFEEIFSILECLTLTSGKNDFLGLF